MSHMALHHEDNEHVGHYNVWILRQSCRLLLLTILMLPYIATADMSLLLCAGQLEVELDPVTDMTEGRVYLMEGSLDYSSSTL